MAKLTVAVDARFLGGERKGIGRYLHTLLAGMSALADAPSFFLLSDRELAVSYPPLSCTPVVIPARTVYTWEQLALPRVLARLGADVFHAPGNALPLRPPRATVVTLHDAMMFERRFHTGAANRYYLYQKWVLRRAVRRCAGLITVSETSARDVRARLGRALRTPVVVIGEAVDPIFTATTSAGALAAFLEARGLETPYILHFGAAFPRKNTRLVLEAYGRVAAELPPFVVAGVSAGDEETVRAWAAEITAGANIKIVGYLPPAEHALLLGGAAALVYPSAYEGFGLPALEAMAVGVPVLASRRGALPETCGDAALYADTEPAALGRAMVALATDAGLRARLTTAGRVRAAAFSPARMAARTLEVYRAAAGAAER